MASRGGKEDAFQVETAGPREWPTQVGLDSARLLAQAGINAADHEAVSRLQRSLLEELHHRVKNTLATVIAITTQSLRNAETLEQGRLGVENRLVGLGRAYDLLLQSNWASAKLNDVIRAAIEPFDGHRRFAIENADLDIGADAVLPLSMFLNELCTNAVKHGALSSDDGHVEIALTANEPTQQFKLRWAETGGPLVREPARRGLGTRLVNRLAAQLHGDITLRYESQGVVCQLDIPLASLRRPVRA